MSTKPPAGQPATAEVSAPARLSRDRALLLAVLVTATFTMILNETIMSTALPRLMADLHLTASTAQWLTTGFTLVMAIVAPTTGFLLQRLGSRTVFLAGTGAFAAGTLLALLAPGFEVLMAARVTQACGTAVMLPLLTTTIARIVPAARLGQYLGLATIAVSFAPAVGPPLSGLIVDALGWRGIFLVLLPVGLAALVLGAAKLRDHDAPERVGLDGWSIPLCALAFGGLVHGAAALGEGHAVAPPWLLVAVGAVALAAFVARQVARERRGHSPLLNLRPFARRPFALATALLSLSVLGQAGSMMLLPLHLQESLGVSTRTAGLLLLPGGLALALLAPPVGRLCDRFGPRPLLLSGSGVLTASLAGLGVLAGHEVSLPTVAAVYLAVNTGVICITGAAMSAAMGSLPPSLHPYGSATLSTLQPLVAALATALYISVMSRARAAGLGDGLGPAAAGAAGARAAFLLGALISSLGIALACLFRRPAPTTASAPAH
ncbi:MULTISPECIES: DHA2 family efflux MFS transporter permease subunit [Streptomyces]|uniref:MFS transporter n=2 Tax=Streptomyces cacaoi TaxID=1898 RepID=A0A4Y3QXQ6_STRCI|nr:MULTISPECIES: DHA2 family efflux MFS transporter permease subunit [Streptomyces]NNG85902.1 DHA2 family efflux MFS transporter permease subunit [Streptomyces cacaoi]QHF94643.1 MFS transporter [Streptomyces sp. NHF165]GEB49739.1 MFS transporter [Streptomyces cacaoi]